ncbi:MAG: SUMF1/EgtB/PvdO family nonheme iron enzyme [Spirulina sp.]
MSQPSPQPPEKTLEKRIANTLFAGSGGFALVFLLLNDIPKALTAGALSVGFGLLSSFGEGFMKVLKKWTNKLGEKLALALTNRADRAIDRVGFANKYYQRLIYRCRDYRTQGLKTKGPFVLDLEKVFVPLRVAPESAERISTAMVRESDGSSGSSIWDFLEAGSDRDPTYSSMAVIGAPGSGKTTLLEHLTLIYAEGKQPETAPVLIPIPIYLRDVGQAIASNNPNLANLVEQQESIKQLDPPDRWFKDMLRRQYCLVMLDGLDEVADQTQRRNVSRWVSEQIRDYPKARFILTSRPFGFKDAPVEGVTILEVQPFNLNQMQQFVQNWYLQSEIARRLGRDDPGVRDAAQTQADDLINRIRNSLSLAKMALNPLLLTMIATVHCYRGALPGRRVELYAEICDVLLGRRREAKGIPLTHRLSAEQQKAVLQVLALALMQGNTREFTIEEGSAFIKDELLQVAGDRETPTAFLERVEQESGLLVERENGVYEFAHKSFQEYLAAVQIKESNQEQILTERMDDPWWDETIRLYAAQSDATPLIRAVLADANPSINALKLALDCEEEGLSVEPELREQLKDKLEAGLESTEPEIASLAARVKLSRGLSKLVRIDENREIMQRYITRAEYQLYVSKMLGTGERFQSGTAMQPITGISWTKVLGFCRWVNNEMFPFPEQYQYRLCSAAESREYPIKEYPELECWNFKASLTREKGIRLVKVSIPDSRRPLLNFEIPVNAKGENNTRGWRREEFGVSTPNTEGEEIPRGYRCSEGFVENLGNGVNLDMVAIFGGTFLMGSPKGEGGENEKPQHEVTVPSFFMSRTPITQAQWRAIASRKDLRVKYDLNPDRSGFKGDNRPVERVTWYDAVEFCKRLSKLTGLEYRLPSEAEWEYACRAGTTTSFSFGETMTPERANYKDSVLEIEGKRYENETTPVGSFPPNAFGLRDMHGNVWEWCADDWHDNYEGAPNDGSAWVENEKENYPVLRGGSWLHYPYVCRSAFRILNILVWGSDLNVGFRVGYGVGRI